jgi:hypothetical protein
MFAPAAFHHQQQKVQKHKTFVSIFSISSGGEHFSRQTAAGTFLSYSLSAPAENLIRQLLFLRAVCRAPPQVLFH